MTQTAIDPFARIDRRLDSGEFLTYKLDDEGNVRAYLRTAKKEEFCPNSYTLVADIAFLSRVAPANMPAQVRDDIALLAYGVGPLDQEFRFTKQENGLYVVEHFGRKLPFEHAKHEFVRVPYSPSVQAAGLSEAHRVLAERLDNNGRLMPLVRAAGWQRRVA